MDNASYNSFVPFCSLRQAFRFDKMSDAKAFFVAFGPTLLLEDDFTVNDEGIWVSVERLEDTYGE